MSASISKKTGDNGILNPWYATAPIHPVIDFDRFGGIPELLAPRLAPLVKQVLALQGLSLSHDIIRDKILPDLTKAVDDERHREPKAGSVLAAISALLAQRTGMEGSHAENGGSRPARVWPIVPVLSNVKTDCHCLQIDLESCSVTFNGELFRDVHPVPLHLMKALHDAGPAQIVAGPKLAKLPGLRGKNLPREIKKLPKRLRDLIGAEGGNGYWLQYPPVYPKLYAGVYG